MLTEMQLVNLHFEGAPGSSQDGFNIHGVPNGLGMSWVLRVCQRAEPHILPTKAGVTHPGCQGAGEALEGWRVHSSRQNCNSHLVLHTTNLPGATWLAWPDAVFQDQAQNEALRILTSPCSEGRRPSLSPCKQVCMASGDLPWSCMVCGGSTLRLRHWSRVVLTSTDAFEMSTQNVSFNCQAW